MNNPTHYILREHCSEKISLKLIDNIEQSTPRLFKNERGQDYNCFIHKVKDKHLHLKADYYVGVDWLVENEVSIQVEPKINTNVVKHFNKQVEIAENDTITVKEADQEAKRNIKEDKGLKELDYLKMLLEVMTNPVTAKQADNLVLIDWLAPKISITQTKDQLTPFLIIQFLQLLKTIVRKGLKKSYYKKQTNLRNKIKGKILVGQHIKQNVFKNHLTQTYCEYQEFGVDNLENRFLKKVWQFCSAYIENHKEIFSKGENFNFIRNILNYTRPAFEQVSDDIKENQLKNSKQNPFFKEYKQAITIGGYILKKFAYNISKTTDFNTETPPFWIDMPFLFELYFHSQLLKANPQDVGNIHFQYRTYGNALDFLISKLGYEMVIDTKYKLHYKWGKVHEDIRQVSGYARLNKVRNKLKIPEDKVINCLIIYPDTEDGIDGKSLSLENIVFEMRKTPISAYCRVFKLGVKLPIIT